MLIINNSKKTIHESNNADATELEATEYLNTILKESPSLEKYASEWKFLKEGGNVNNKLDIRLDNQNYKGAEKFWVECKMNNARAGQSVFKVPTTVLSAQVLIDNKVTVFDKVKFINNELQYSRGKKTITEFVSTYKEEIKNAIIKAIEENKETIKNKNTGINYDNPRFEEEKTLIYFVSSEKDSANKEVKESSVKKINLTKKDIELLTKDIIDHYFNDDNNKKTNWLLCKYDNQNFAFFNLSNTDDLLEFFDVSATLRYKRSGTGNFSLKKLNEFSKDNIKKYIDDYLKSDITLIEGKPNKGIPLSFKLKKKFIVDNKLGDDITIKTQHDGITISLERNKNIDKLSDEDDVEYRVRKRGLISINPTLEYSIKFKADKKNSENFTNKVKKNKELFINEVLTFITKHSNKIKNKK